MVQIKIQMSRLISCGAVPLLAALSIGQSCAPAPLPEPAEPDELVLGYVPASPDANLVWDSSPSTPSLGTDPDDPDGSTAPPPPPPAPPPVTESEEQEPPMPEWAPAPQAIRLSASVLAGSVPLGVAFQASPVEGHFPSSVECDWSLGSQALRTAAAQLHHEFADPGSFQVSVCVQSQEWLPGTTLCDDITVVAMAPPAPNAPNLGPGAFNGQAMTSRNMPIQLILTGADPEGNSLTFSMVSPPAYGTTGPLVHTGHDSASVTYTPEQGFLGFDEFQFQVSDGSSVSLPAKMRIEVINTDPPPIRVVAVPALHRVFGEDVAIEGDSTVSVKSARGESESCQVVVVNYGTEPLRNVNVSCSLRGADGAAVNPSVTAFRVHYVQVGASIPGRRSGLSNSPTWSGPGWHPDALIPFQDPYIGGAPTTGLYKAGDYELPAGESQPYWIDFAVPAGAPAGRYDGSVHITADGFDYTMPIELEVWNFELPAASALPTWFGCAVSRIQSVYGTGTDAARLDRLVARHTAILEAHRIYSITLPRVPCDVATGRTQVDAAYLNLIRSIIEARQLKVCALNVGESWPIRDAFGTGWVPFTTYLRDIDQMLRDNPWIPPAFIYIVDEPNTALEHEQVYRIGQFLRSEQLIIKNFVTGSLHEVEDWAPLEGNIDIWTYFWGRTLDMEAVAARKAAGHQVWSYSALANGTHGPSWLLDAPILDYAVPFWASWSLDLQGLLYWTVLLDCNRWGIDPWVNPATLTYADGSGGLLEMNGEGLLVMPGLPAGVDGPLPTIRLKTIRDGLDCYSYLQILADRDGRGVSDEIARGVAASYRQWSPDYRVFLAARERLAQEILARPQR